VHPDIEFVIADRVLVLQRYFDRRNALADVDAGRFGP
jgi:hypothetical protein